MRVKFGGKRFFVDTQGEVLVSSGVPPVSAFEAEAGECDSFALRERILKRRCLVIGGR